ncbi:MAG TPA: peptide chain release factor N(5)-glutamine methyltransferase [Polyangiaceae bacterium]|nr:peptide chain release factor N(5)-glutamine methyltransferase [Polyangiaceae bacterium]
MTAVAQPPAWTSESILRWATDDFRARGIDTPRLDAELLLGQALSVTRIQLIVDAKRPLSSDELARFRELVKRRRAREPVAYILGQREFYGRLFRVDRRVLVPRPDTECLVEAALERTNGVSLSARVLDLCTGSGCVAITLARERPTTRVMACDISEDALAVARDNALRLGAYNVAFGRGDLFAGAASRMRSTRTGFERFDVVTANPPYIPAGEIPGLQPEIREHEPRLALLGGADGLSVVARIVEGAPAVLSEGGVLAVEVAAGQAEAVDALFEKRGFTAIERKRDYGRIERVVSGIFRKA